MSILKYINAGDLCIAYEESGNRNATPVILLHGFPYDVRAYDEVVEKLSTNNFWIIIPYLRGFGPTRFLLPHTMRSGQQAALANDLISLMDALYVDSAILCGYDWGGRAACIVAALFPNRVKGLVSVAGYNIQNIAKYAEPALPEIDALRADLPAFLGVRGKGEDGREQRCRRQATAQAQGTRAHRAAV